MNKKKAGFMKRLVKVVRSHFYDVFKSVYEEGTENAKEKHDVNLPQGEIKEIIKDAIKRNKAARPDWKATKAEVQEIINSGAKQAWAALRNDNKELETDEDKFLASLDLDLDNLDDEDWKDILGDDFDEEDLGMESIEERIEAQFQGAKDYTEGRNDFDPPVDEEASVVTTMTDNNISAAILIFLAGVKKCPDFARLWREHHAEIASLIEGTTADEYPVDQIDSGDDTNLNDVKAMVKAVNEEMVPFVGYTSPEQDGMESEEDNNEIDSQVIVSVEEQPLDETPDYSMTQDKLSLYKEMGTAVDTIIEQIEDKATPEMHNIFSIWDFKLGRVAKFAATICGCSPDRFEQLFREELKDMCNVCDCTGIPYEVCVYFYLGIVPTKYIELGYRVCHTYCQVIDQN